MRYFFEDCALDPDRRELRRGPDVVPTAPQVLDLLEYLIRSRDRVVSKDDLINAIWNGRIVSDAALTTRLNAVRRAIGDSGEQQRLIKTFPRKGFRFVGAVHDGDRCSEAAVASGVLAEPSNVARAAAAFVIGREIALTYKNKLIDLKQLGTNLGTRWAVRGAVRRNGDQVRISVSLTDLQTVRDVWSDRFDGDSANLAVLENNIAA